MLVALAVVLFSSSACFRGRTITLKAGGPAPSGTIRYQLDDQDVSVGEQTLPWSATFERSGASAARVNVDSGQTAWCEVWIDGELCDREDDGTWCACYHDRRKGWSGWPNDDESKATHIP